KHPEIDILHLWFDDSFGGSWCECKNCRDKDPYQQQLHIINSISASIKERYPQLILDMLLYHDTLEINDNGEQPDTNVLGFYAPRERCYTHSIADKQCSRNRDYFEKLLKAVRTFQDNTYV